MSLSRWSSHWAITHASHRKAPKSSCSLFHRWMNANQSCKSALTRMCNSCRKLAVGSVLRRPRSTIIPLGRGCLCCQHPIPAVTPQSRWVAYSFESLNIQDSRHQGNSQQGLAPRGPKEMMTPPPRPAEMPSLHPSFGFDSRRIKVNMCLGIKSERTVNPFNVSGLRY